MSASADPARFEVAANGVELACEAAGAGPAVVLLHGLTATRRYVVHGSRALERSGLRVIAYDARGHGDSSRAPDPEAYEYADLRGDLQAVLESAGVDEATLVGHSMGAATACALALRDPDRVRALVLVTPAYAGSPPGPEDLAGWDRLAAGLRSDGVDGFLDAWNPSVDDDYRETVIAFTRQRLERHRDLDAVADAIATVPRSTAFDGLGELERLDLPVLVVGSRDDADPGHRLAVAESYVERLPRSELTVEEPGASPLAWQGGQLSRRIVEFLTSAGVLGG